MIVLFQRRLNYGDNHDKEHESQNNRAENESFRLLSVFQGQIHFSVSKELFRGGGVQNGDHAWWQIGEQRILSSLFGNIK